MSENLGLYQFWMAAEYGETVYYLPEAQAYLVAEIAGEILHIHQNFSRNRVDPERIEREDDVSTLITCVIFFDF